MMQPVPGHPYVMAESIPEPGGMIIVCRCRHCGDVWQHRCLSPPKAPVWVAKYAAQHAHGNPALRAHFARQYHMGLQNLRIT